MDIEKQSQTLTEHSNQKEEVNLEWIECSKEKRPKDIHIYKQVRLQQSGTVDDIILNISVQRREEAKHKWQVLVDSIEHINTFGEGKGIRDIATDIIFC